MVIDELLSLNSPAYRYSSLLDVIETFTSFEPEYGCEEKTVRDDMMVQK